MKVEFAAVLEASIVRVTTVPSGAFTKVPVPLSTWTVAVTVSAPLPVMSGLCWSESVSLELTNASVIDAGPVATGIVFPAGPACGEACASTTVVPVEVALIWTVHMPVPLVVVHVVVVSPPRKVELAAVLAASMLRVTTVPSGAATNVPVPLSTWTVAVTVSAPLPVMSGFWASESVIFEATQIFVIGTVPVGTPIVLPAGPACGLAFASTIVVPVESR